MASKASSPPTRPDRGQECARLEALRSYQVLDTPPEPVFDDLVRLAAQVCGTPAAAISFLDAERQWLKARFGPIASEHRHGDTFCARMVAGGDLLIFGDAAAEQPLAAETVMADAGQVPFSAGAPLLTTDGHVLGMLCVMDQQPRTLDLEQQESLRALARQVVAQLDLRRSIRALELAALERSRVDAELRRSQDRFQEFMNNSPALAYIKDEAGRFVYVNEQTARRFQIPALDWVGKTDAELFGPEMARAVEEHDLSVFNDGLPREVEETADTPDGKSRYWSSHKFLLHDGDGRRQLGGLSFDITERKRTEHERERLLSELREALATVKTLGGLIPICASCKNIRDDEGYWKQIESYLGEHSDLEFTHGICPACLEKLYPEFVAAQRDALSPGG